MPEPDATWDLQRLRTIAAGTTVRCEGAPEDVARVMAVLGADAAESSIEVPLASQLRTFHADDRDAVVLAWREALDEPGKLAEAEGLQLVDGDWRRTRMQVVNLFDTELRVVVVMVTDLGAVPDEAVPRRGEFDPVPGAPASWALIGLALDGRVTSAEGTTRDLLGSSPEELVGSRLLQVIHPDDRTVAGAMGATAVSMPGLARALTHRLVRRDGSEVWVETTITYEPERQELRALVTDITVRRSQEAALQASRESIRELAEEFRLLAEEIPSGAFRADESGHLRFANTRFRALASDRPFDDLRSLAAPDDVALVDAAVTRAVARARTEGESVAEPVQVEFRARDDARILQLRLTATPPTGRASTALVGLLVDATPTVELRTRARTDDLTGLFNRSALDGFLDDALANGSPVSVLFVDLDRFKQVNDVHGHHAGDEVLREVARRLRHTVRASDALGRYGGDEFVAVCHTGDEGVLREIARRLATCLVAPIPFDGGYWQPSASIGTATALPGEDAEALLRRADADMYRLKAGRAADPPRTGAAADDPPDENTV